jgi:DNA-binding response OmpR family regulator
VPHCVLVADGYPDAAPTLAKLLGLMGHEAHVATDGPGAIEAARRFRPDVVLLEIDLAVVDGFEVARRLRGEFDGDVALFALSAHGAEADRRRAYEAGFDGFMTKPADPDALTAVLRSGRPRSAGNG